MPNVPAIDASPDEGVDGDAVGKLAEAEISLLEAEYKAKQKVNREADQRYWLRWATVILTTAIITCMGSLLYHVAHRLPAPGTRDVSAAYVIAVYVAPIISMSTLSIALLVAAFRGFKDGDEKAGILGVADGARAGGLIN